MQAENLDFTTGCPVRIFEAFTAFVNSQTPSNNFSTAKEDIYTPRIVNGLVPKPVEKAKLILAIHEVEDTFVIYAEDTVDRVVSDFISQKEEGIKKSLKNRKSAKIELKKNYAVSVSILMNDIQNFANLYRAFRDANKDFFEFEEGNDFSYSASAEKMEKDSNGDVYVPVVPALSDAFY